MLFCLRCGNQDSVWAWDHAAGGEDSHWAIRFRNAKKYEKKDSQKQQEEEKRKDREKDKENEKPSEGPKKTKKRPKAEDGTTSSKPPKKTKKWYSCLGWSAYMNIALLLTTLLGLPTMEPAGPCKVTWQGRPVGDRGREVQLWLHTTLTVSALPICEEKKL